MKLDRNEPANQGRGKYALLKLREWPHGWSPDCQAAFDLLANAGAIDFGDKSETEFFVIRLKDKYAHDALKAYSVAAARDDPEYAQEVNHLSVKAKNHASKRMPD